MTETEYITQRLDNQQQWHSKESRSCQIWHKRLRCAEFVLSAAIPFITAVLWGSVWGMWVISAFGFIITVLSAVQGIWHFQERGADYRAVSEALKREKFLYLSGCGPYHDEKCRFPCLVERVEAVLAVENKSWLFMCRSPDKG